MKLASGAAPVVKYLSAGVALGLGTDGAASNNDLDMFEAMRQAAFLAKLTTRDPTAVPARVALDMATIGGARALGMERLIGSLEQGKRADLITVSTVGSPADAPLRSGIAPGVHDTWRRRPHDHRERQGADARPPCSHARSGIGHCRREPRGGGCPCSGSLAAEDGDRRQIAVLFRIVETVSDDKTVLDCQSRCIPPVRRPCGERACSGDRPCAASSGRALAECPAGR